LKEKYNQVKLSDLEMINTETGETTTIVSDIYDIIDRKDNMLHLRNTTNNEEIIVLEEMVKKYINNKVEGKK